MVVVPEKISDLRDEGRNQHNCVGSYMDRVANGETDVVFIRRMDRPKESYITVEIDPYNGKIVQARQIYNQNIYDEADLEFLKDFRNHIAAVMDEEAERRKTA